MPFRDEQSIHDNKDNLPIDSMSGKVSHVKQYIEDQEKRSREKPVILSNRKHRSSSLDERDGSSLLLRSSSNPNKDAGTFTNGKGVKNSLYANVLFYVDFYR